MKKEYIVESRRAHKKGLEASKSSFLIKFLGLKAFSGPNGSAFMLFLDSKKQLQAAQRPEIFFLILRRPKFLFRPFPMHKSSSEA